jgi:hypothetical protein
MTEAPDPLEAELSALQPHEPSPGLRQRIADSLADAPPAKLRRVWWFALAGGLAAACLAAVLFWWGAGRRIDSKRIIVRPQPARSVEGENSEPTLLMYQHALARSPEALDALLDKQAVVAPEANPELVPIGPFSRSDAVLHTLLGDD